MVIKMKFVERVLDETLCSTSLLYFEQGFFFLICSFYLAILKWTSVRNKFKVKISNFFNKFYKSHYSRLFLTLETKPTTVLGVFYNFDLLNKLKKKFFLLQNVKNFFFLLSQFEQNFSFLFPNNLLLTYGALNYGTKKFKNFKNFVNYSPDLNGVYVCIIFNAPYIFMKRYPLLNGMKNIIVAEIHPLMLICSVKNSIGVLWVIETPKFHKKRKLLQICKIFWNEFNLIACNKISSKNNIIFATEKENAIKTWRIIFDKRKKFSNFELCGFTNHANRGKIINFFWGGIFCQFLFSGDMYGGIFLWNEILNPIFHVSISGFILQDLKAFTDLLTIVIVLKKERGYKNRRNIDKNLQSLPQTILKIYKLEKNLIRTSSYILCIINFFKFKKNLVFTKEFFRKINEISIFFDNFKVAYLISELSLIYCDVCLISYYFSHALSIFHRIIRKFFSKFIYPPFPNVIPKHKNFMFRVRLLSKVRYLSFAEIKLEQSKIMYAFNRFFYQKCQHCHRLTKFWQKKRLKQVTCIFFHSFLPKFLKSLKPNSYSFKKNIEENLESSNNSFFFLPASKLLNIKIGKRLFLQEEFKWIFS